ncbi:MAG: SDR family NAD(P)-dependent oxidoreductase [Bdellovibrionota bacterium]
MNQTIVVFGATSAIAKEYCRLKAQQNHFVLIARDQGALDDLTKDLIARQAQGVRALKYDFENVTDLGSLINEAFSGPVDVALFAYGTLPDENKCRSDATYLERFHRVNITSSTMLLTLVAEKMKKQKNGSIAFITSVAGDRGKISNYHYGSAKSAISTFLQGLRQDLFKDGIHVADIKPGFVDTPMTVNLKKGILWASPISIARGIDRAIQSRKNVSYLPFFWRYIMLIIRMIPETIFKRMKL